MPDAATTELYAHLRDQKGCGFLPDQPDICRCGSTTFRTLTSPEPTPVAVGCTKTGLWLIDEAPPDADTYHDDAVEALIS